MTHPMIYHLNSRMKMKNPHIRDVVAEPCTPTPQYIYLYIYTWGWEGTKLKGERTTKFTKRKRTKKKNITYRICR